jgi:hypothetical protein
MDLQNQKLNVVQSQRRFSTPSPATAPEMLATEVTPGLQQEQSPTPISFLCHDLFNGVIKRVETREDITQTQGLGPASEEQRRS